MSLHKKPHFWLYSAAAAWWLVELYVQNGPGNNALTPLYQQLAAIDVALPGNSLLPSSIPSGAVYLAIAGVIAQRMHK